MLPCPSWLSRSLEGGFVDWWTATQRTLDRIGLASGDRVLEIGPGPGRLLIPAAARVRPGGTVVGLDVQAGMIERLKKRGAGVENLSTELGNAENMPFGEACFDVVYMAMVLGEIPHREQALAECFRVLKPGGRLSITEMAADPHFQSRATVTRLAAAAGFVRPDIIGRPWSFTASFAKPTSAS
ncbi:MAG TPA: methyltransferase domain-containing protein [Pirellulales bacterium]|nr:methyltransferase domain-containing protein [Pirellulales bacterium]